ncbi:GT99 family glycosyltransferase N-terminal domain-containing protein [Candidatus Steffania adelgidicola]|uniref:GT99 family glycosyltransferase N-terminal domain-containing protein n=1 Tax=Candidatus Steffania adelgidicola TaxID=1076626 RepID=UPI001D01007E|nr:glycosyltransferase [Candidatus Steffania adelgidicola]UDG79560.1 hypothetical protein GFK82_00065 [Candidatus Steffania adelgidicola]
MISIFLPGFPFRGLTASYLWFFYRILSSIEEPIYFIMGKEYLTPIEQWKKNKRWEMTEESQARLGYQFPDFLSINQENFSIIDESFFKEYLKDCFNNPDYLFKRFITEEIPRLMSEIDKALKNVSDIECILTWCNCPSLNQVATKKNIRVINLELGPLRHPHYLSTGYFDFHGVNGNTEAEKRFLSVKESALCFCNRYELKTLRDFFYNHSVSNLDITLPEYDVGIVLQVENDSNILAFSNTFNNQSLLDYAACHNLGRKLIRNHPSSHFSLNQGLDQIDDSTTSIDFITRCKHILTINSSVGLEAMLLDVPTTIMGDCSYSFCNVTDSLERKKRLAFYLFSYLVPFNLLFDVGYIRFRLSFPSEMSIIEKHIDYYVNNWNYKLNSNTELKKIHFINNSIIEWKNNTPINTVISNLHRATQISERLKTKLEIKEERIEKIKKKISKKNIKIDSGFLVDIIIPVYAGLKETQECIESVLAILPDWAELIVINDYSLDQELTQWLHEHSQKEGGFTLLKNPRNLGFVATANRGMQLHLNRDILLLNNDVKIANDCLERIRKAAYSKHRLGSITPFSNNATICSFPNFCEDNELFMGLDVKQLDEQFSAYGHINNLLEIPTGVGCCMYIRRDCLNKIGYFSVEKFGRGYGEENDWCQRAIKAGWKNFHQLNVFIQHKGGVSFCHEQHSRKKHALELLNILHPNYSKDMMDFIKKDPAQQAREQLILQILAKKNIKKVLLISHNMSGGVTHHLNELVNFYKKEIHFLLLAPEAEKNRISLSLNINDTTYKKKFIIDISYSYDTLINLLRFIGIGHIHFHHLINIPDKIFFLHHELSCGYDITIHDYYCINSNPTLTDKNGVFSGNDIAHRDTLCSEHYPIPGGVSATEWRIKLSSWLEGAERIIFPSTDTQVRFMLDFPNIEYKSIIAWHPDFEVNDPYQTVTFPFQIGKILKVLVIGAISREKGALILDEVANELKDQGIEFHLLGYAFRTLGGAIKCHGAYTSQDLEEKLNYIKPDVIWFPAQWPETYSYTLSIALEQGLPIVVPNIGAFSERVTGRKYTKIIAWNTSIKTTCEMWRSFRDDPVSFFSSEDESSLLDISLSKRSKKFYQYNYVQPQWLRESKLERVDYKSLLASLYSSEYVEVVPTFSKRPQGYKEKLLAILWKISTHPLLALIFKLVPYRLQRRIKRLLSHKAIHEILKP